MSAKPHFVFDSNEYLIKDAEIVAVISDPFWCDTYNKGAGKAISWSISFATKSRNDELPPPSVHFHNIKIAGRNWCDLVGYNAEWTDATNVDTNDPYGTIYVYDHQLVSNGSVKVTARDGKRFHIVACGENEEGQRFTINSTALFKGIIVKGSEKDTDESVLERLRQFVDPSNLVGSPFELSSDYENGVKMGSAFFEPSID